MSALDAAKQQVWTLWHALDRSPESELAALLARYYHDEARWHGAHPINELTGPTALADGLWRPLRRAFPDLQRRTHLFFGGESFGGTWVTGTGYLEGRFEHDWLGIPATRSRTALRFGEFNRVEGGKIVESYVLFDILDLIRRAGYPLLTSDGGTEGDVPGPASGDGVLLNGHLDDESAESLRLVEAMLGGLRSYDRESLASMGMTRYWHPNMLWFGPAGIGTTVGLRGFEDHHQRPFLTAFPDRRGGNHRARFAEGHYVATTGWPSLTATHLGPYLGLPATGRRIEMRVMDWWRREGDLLVENWVLLDMLDNFNQLGVDLLDRLRMRVQQQDEV